MVDAEKRFLIVAPLTLVEIENFVFAPSSKRVLRGPQIPSFARSSSDQWWSRLFSPELRVHLDNDYDTLPVKILVQAREMMKRHNLPPTELEGQRVS